MNNRRITWKIIGRGHIGWHSDGLTADGNKVSSSGGDLKDYLAESDPGTLVYDAMEANDGDFVAMVYAGPIVDATLQPGQVHRFTEKACLAAMLPGLGGAFQVMGIMALLEDNDSASHPKGENRIGSMDMVAPDLYMAMLKAKVKDIKLGKVNDQHEVVWE